MSLQSVRPSLSALTIAASLSVSGVGEAAVLVADDFDSLGNGVSLNTRLPATTINNAPWVAATGNFLGNGTGGVAVTFADATVSAASINLGSGFFTSNPGIYELSLTITNPTDNNTSWVGFGFSRLATTNQNLVGNEGAPWMLFRLNGNVNYYAGTATSNQLTNGGLTNAATVTASTAGTPHTFTLRLNTAVTQWTLDGFIDGAQVDLNGTTTTGNTFTYGTNPTGSQYIQLAMAPNTTTASKVTVDNLTFSSVPEPQSLMTLVGGVGVLFGLQRFRRRS